MAGPRFDPDSIRVAIPSHEGERFVLRLTDVVTNLAHRVAEKDGELDGAVLVGLEPQLLELPDPARRHSPRRLAVDDKVDAIDHPPGHPTWRQDRRALSQAPGAIEIDTHSVRASWRAVR